ncbi:MAG TPA: NAD-dependent epimerase/dehydratase family protein [Balneolales bacterium]|nr:NAD-dependent epimerase/dehydratase family protein [Balneolales bacterium]
MAEKYLITGAGGQIGSELSIALAARYDSSNVIIAGHRKPLPPEIENSGHVITLDVCDPQALEAIVERYGITTIYHLAGVLSVIAESHPHKAWDINVNGLRNILEVSAKHGCAVFFPSSIGAFGPQTPPDNTPQETIQRPSTIYGITKVAGELLCDYYHNRYGVDTRGLRFPGLISYLAPPGGGTTDYAVEIFHDAVNGREHKCFLAAGTFLDMMYMPDAIKAIIRLMEADPSTLIHRNAYNITAMSFDPEAICAEIQKHIPLFTMSYNVDSEKQAIADSWPNKMDDSAARSEWGWNPHYDLPAMVVEMLKNITP